MRLIPGVSIAPAVIAAIDTNNDGVFSQAEKEAYARRVLGDLSITMDGKSIQPQLASWTFPDPGQMREGLGEIVIDYLVVMPQGGSNRVLTLTNHHVNPGSVYLMNATVPQDPNLQIVAQKRNESQSAYELDFQQKSDSVSPAQGWRGRLNALQFGSLFHLGMRHIAEGTDHLLFLLVLLLPAPLIAVNMRWEKIAGVRQTLARILGIVTAFTVGHSITLTLAAMNVVHVPERPIEILIAVSILVSAVHALRPLVPGREAWIAASFGLIHGLAFAATLGRLGLTGWERLIGILAFNVGIEAMQMLVVVLVLPSLMLLSRTRAYPILRVSGAVLVGAASLGWIAERLFNLQTPVDSVTDAIARHALWVAGFLLLLSLTCRYVLGDSTEGQVRLVCCPRDT